MAQRDNLQRKPKINLSFFLFSEWFDAKWRVFGDGRTGDHREDREGGWWSV